MFDIWSNDEKIVDEVYGRANYKVVLNHNSTENTCVIYFSSNNIWYPNEKRAFVRSFIDNDYYEWEKYIHKKAKKEIFVRDIYKSWYVKGINSKVDSVDKLMTLLRIETEGMEVITVGSSAGGYMACLCGAELNAKYVLCFAAQFNLRTKYSLEVNPYLKKYEKDMGRSKYYNIVSNIEKSDTIVYYFLPFYCKADSEQLAIVQNLSNVKSLKMLSRRHGVPIFKCNLSELLCMSNEELDKLFDDYDEKVNSPLVFSIKISGFRKTVQYIFNKCVKLIKSRVRRN